MTESTSATPHTAHEVMKTAYTRGTKIYRVTMHNKRGPSVITLNGLFSGQTFTFDRMSGEDSDDSTSTVLRLTQSEVHNLRGAHFTIEEVDAADVESIDPFGDSLLDSLEGTSIIIASDWPLVQTPAEYLDNNPDGPKAELARKMIENGLPNASRGK